MLSMAILSGVTTAKPGCLLRYDKWDYMPWFDYGRGIAYGLYMDPPMDIDDCAPCDELGNKFGEINYTLRAMLEQRIIWENK